MNTLTLNFHRYTDRRWQAPGGQLSERVKVWYQRAHQRRQLAQLDARALRDVGISREQAAAEAAKPFWQA